MTTRDLLLRRRGVGKVELTVFEDIPTVDRERIVEEVVQLFMPKKIKWT